MITQDIYLIERDDDVKMFSANGVPYPLDEYLKLIGKPTIEDGAKIIRKWGK